MPFITLEVMSDSTNTSESSLQENIKESEDQNSQSTTQQPIPPCISDSPEEIKSEKHESNKESNETPKARGDLLEYMLRSNGSVICKLCGEILQSRTHWYRHKYKQHAIQPLNPSPLFQCDQCLVYFKSRKGYIGHLASRHSELLSDSSPVLTNNQVEAMKEISTQNQNPPEVKEEPDPELSIPTSSVLNYQTTITKQTATKSTETRRPYRNSKGDPPNNQIEWEEKRSREEKLVADIIDRVRRECEAQGSGRAARRGYTRRTTIMNT